MTNILNIRLVALIAIVVSIFSLPFTQLQAQSSEPSYYFGPWVWYEATKTNPIEHWGPPEGASVGLDLRSIQAQGRRGGPAQGYGIFESTETLPNPYILLGTADEVLNNGKKNQLIRDLRLSKLNASTVQEAIYEIMTEEADPNGAQMAPPIMPGADEKIHFKLGNMRVEKDFVIGGPEWPKVQAMYRKIFRDVKTKSDQGQAEQNLHRQMLTVWLEKYGLDESQYELFVPNEIRSETPLPHNTTITESFNTADSGTLGPDLTWSEVSGTWEVSNNQATSDSNARDTASRGSARAQSDLSSDDHYAQIVKVNNPFTNFQGGGPMVRFSAAAESGYASFVRGNGSAFGCTVTIDKIVNSVVTNLTTSSTCTTTNVTIRLEVDGSDLEVFVNGVSTLTTTDSSITGNTRGGINRYDNGSGGDLLFDDFEAADLAAATIAISGTTNAPDGATVKVAVDGSVQAQTGTTASSVWSISGVTVTSGQVVTVFLDGVADASESTAIAKYDGSGDMTGIVLNTNVLSIGSVDDQSISLTDAATYDSSDDEDVMHSVSNGVLSVQGSGNTYSDETLKIESGDTLAIANGESVTTDNINIVGTVTQTNSGTITVSGNWTNSGTFTAGSGTVVFDDANQISTLSGSTTFNNLSSTTAGKNIRFTSVQVFRINGTFTLTGSASSKIMIESTSAGVQWYINLQGSVSFSHVNIRDSGCDEGSSPGPQSLDVDLTSSTNVANHGNNDGSCWLFAAGNVYGGGIGGGFYGTISGEGSGSGTQRSGGESGGGDTGGGTGEGGEGTGEGSGEGEQQEGGGQGGGGKGDLGALQLDGRIFAMDFLKLALIYR